MAETSRERKIRLVANSNCKAEFRINSCVIISDINFAQQFYQIYPRSFKDSNNDGTGDIRGIIQKLPHLKETGVTATWLSPILKSPQVDYGYDISDFTEVDEIFGTNADLEELFAEAKKLGIKVVMDFVIDLMATKKAC